MCRHWRHIPLRSGRNIGGPVSMKNFINMSGQPEPKNGNEYDGYTYSKGIVLLVALLLAYIICEDFCKEYSPWSVIPAFCCGLLPVWVINYYVTSDSAWEWKPCISNILFYGGIILFCCFLLADVMNWVTPTDVTVIFDKIQELENTVFPRAFCSGALVGQIVFVAHCFIIEIHEEKEWQENHHIPTGTEFETFKREWLQKH